VRFREAVSEISAIPVDGARARVIVGIRSVMLAPAS